MCQLRCYLNSSVASRPQRPLLVQCVRPLLQDERHQPAPRQTKKKNGKIPNITEISLTFLIMYIFGIISIFTVLTL